MSRLKRENPVLQELNERLNLSSFKFSVMKVNKYDKIKISIIGEGCSIVTLVGQVTRIYNSESFDLTQLKGEKVHIQTNKIKHIIKTNY